MNPGCAREQALLLEMGDRLKRSPKLDQAACAVQYPRVLNLVCCVVGSAAVTPGAPCVQVIDIPNSMTVLPELIPYSIQMVRAHW